MRTPDSDPTRYTPGSYDHEFDAPLSDSIFDETLPLASPWTRLGAVFLNLLILIGASIPGAILLGVGEDSNSEGIAVMGGLLLFGAWVGLAIYQTIILSRDGQSIGKRILNIRIVDAIDDSNPGFARVILLRYVVMQLLALVPLVGLIDALMIFSEDHKTLHDRLATTVVVSERGIY